MVHSCKSVQPFSRNVDDREISIAALRSLPELIQNVNRLSHGHSTPSLKISCKSVQPFSPNVADKESLRHIPAGHVVVACSLTLTRKPEIAAFITATALNVLPPTVLMSSQRSQTSPGLRRSIFSSVNQVITSHHYCKVWYTHSLWCGSVIRNVSVYLCGLCRNSLTCRQNVFTAMSIWFSYIKYWAIF